MRCQTSRKRVREVNPRVSLLVIISIVSLRATVGSEAIPTYAGDMSPRRRFVGQSPPRNDRKGKRLARRPFTIVQGRPTGRRNRTRLGTMRIKIPKTKYVFGDLSRIRLALSLYPSSIQTLTVGLGVSPSHASCHLPEGHRDDVSVAKGPVRNSSLLISRSE